MMQYSVSIHQNGIVKKVSADEGANLLKLLRSNGVLIDTPCGGKGTCGKCAVSVKGIKAAAAEKERSLLGGNRLEKGYRLACYITVHEDMDVYPDEDLNETAAIVTEGRKRDIAAAPMIKKQYVEMPGPSLNDQLPDAERLIRAAGREISAADISVLREIPKILRSSGFKVTLVSMGDELISVEPGDTTGLLYGTAFDIGTTTVAAYLYDLNSGKCAAVSSMINPQRQYGADVISRISFTMQSAGNTGLMQRLILDCINSLIGRLVREAGIKNEDIYAAVFTGNTTMLHFLLGLETESIAVSPFIPVTTRLNIFKSGLSGMSVDMNKNGAGVTFPGVSAYIGGDTVAAVLSSGMYGREGTALLIDIGTNGEIVLGDKNGMFACSTAAGPAFEGANIKNGVGGVRGAIDTVGPGPAFKYTTIGNASPVGICGSGLIEAVARLIDAGIIDETGRLAGEEEAAGFGRDIEKRLAVIDGTRTFILVPEGENGASGQIVITQKDIRELQNAKAAIAAGIETLIKVSGKTGGSVAKVYLAGGFGSNIKVESALKTGLLPRWAEGRIEAVGNAAGAGAAEGLLSADMLDLAGNIGKSIRYVELSARADFAEKYVDNMFF